MHAQILMKDGVVRNLTKCMCCVTSIIISKQDIRDDLSNFSLILINVSDIFEAEGTP